MKKNKIVLLSFLGLIIALFIYVPIKTELSVRDAKRKIISGTQLNEYSLEFGEPIRIESKEEKRDYASIRIAKGQQLWMIPREGVPYWNTLIITDDSGLIITGDVDRLW